MTYTLSVGQPLIDKNPQLQSYYHSLESRIGYRIFLGGTRHFGFYEHDTWWPFPISRSLRAMEDKLAGLLELPRGASVLDAGCGVGHVAIHLATEHGYKVQGIDIIEHHLYKARRNITRAGLSEHQVTVRKMDYHHLQSLRRESFDGIYTMETFVHATDPESVLAGFFRLLRPGGRLALFEYDHVLSVADTQEQAAMVEDMRKINEFAAMPTNSRSHPGTFKEMLEDAGFEDVVVRDYSENIRPMTRLFFLVAYVPYLIVTMLGLQRYFINTVAGVQSYRGRDHWHYLAISARKPGTPIEPAKDR
ncbi:class I SAM-dependent methyltransferase [Aspergillus homomorphus CBS 101889]|uniref:S-adenosyl-L-methionine-dependent methyltransferase n=1 Tax=Aspergillus homomorphus (strain CBS 101889) TaxID=1450537 RepID=A0A395ICS9_ASPHC|nr:S-adenosyl-L-methionine-dependent methyltransferase [Aspergillus homomorphus CBS 101889]RAL17629.1 S-adenosyl-L-methionine-dependent methyltransferase [Aspergillus homomorphus CBS 101889]